MLNIDSFFNVRIILKSTYATFSIVDSLYLISYITILIDIVKEDFELTLRSNVSLIDNFDFFEFSTK